MRIKSIVKLAVVAGGTIGTAAIIKAKALSEDKEVKEWLLNKGYAACNKVERLASCLGDTLTDLGGTTYDGLTSASYNMERKLDKLKKDSIEQTEEVEEGFGSPLYPPMVGMGRGFGMGMGMNPDGLDDISHSDKPEFEYVSDNPNEVHIKDFEKLFGEENLDKELEEMFEKEEDSAEDFKELFEGEEDPDKDLPTSNDVELFFNELVERLDKITEKGVKIGKSAKENLIKTAQNLSKNIEEHEKTDAKESLAAERAKIDKKIKELDSLRKEIQDIIKEYKDVK